MRLCLLVMSEATPNDCLNLSGTRTTEDLTKLIKKSSEDLNLIQRTTDNEDAESGRNCFFPGKNMPTGYLIPNGQS